MIYETKEIVLKDGTNALFRAPLKEDAEEMLNYLKTVCGETEFLANYPEDIKADVTIFVVFASIYSSIRK